MFTQSSSLGLQIAFLIGIALPLSSERLSNPRTRLSKTSFFKFKASQPFVFDAPSRLPPGGLALLRPRLRGSSPEPRSPGAGAPRPQALLAGLGGGGHSERPRRVSPRPDTPARSARPRIPRATGPRTLIIRRRGSPGVGGPAPRVRGSRVGAGFRHPSPPAPRPWSSGHIGVTRPQACGQYQARPWDPGTLGTDTRDPFRLRPFAPETWVGGGGAKPAKQFSLLINKPKKQRSGLFQGELDKKEPRYPFQRS